MAKRQLKLRDALKKGYATVYDQCSQEVKDKLEATYNWERIQQNQSLHKLIQKVEQICVGFDDHKQEVFNLVQALKPLFLYTQGEKDGVDQYGCNFRSLWGMVEVFRGLPGVHKGLVNVLLKDPSWVNDVHNVTPKERAETKETACKAVKAAMLISSADKRQYGKLRDNANNYLLGTNQYPDTFDKALRILGNYQTSKSCALFRASQDNTGVAFLQQGGCGGRGSRRGCGRGTGRGKFTGEGANAGGGGSDGMSAITGASGGEAAARMSSQGKLHCFNCGAMDHWAYECPQLGSKQQAQLHMNLEGQGDTKEQQEEGHQLLNVMLAHGGNLPRNRAYLDGCSMVTAFKTGKYLKGIKTLPSGIKINCNVGTVSTICMGTYGELKVWYLPGGIVNIFLMHELEKLYQITYDSWEGHYIVHTPPRSSQVSQG